MGKGSRNRILRAQDRVTNPAAQRTKKQAPKWVGVLVTTVIVLILAASITLGTLNSSGVFKRNTTVVKTENFEVTGTMMEYFFKERYNAYISEMSYYIQLGYVKLDTSKSLKTQIQSGTTTWFDYFMNLTTTRVSQLLAYCEGAKKEGITLTAEEKAEIEANIKSLYDSAKAYADMYGMAVKGYMSTTYGKGVTKKDIRAAMTIEKLASKYANILYERFEDAITKEDIDKYYGEHTDDYTTADYLSYKFEVTKDAVKESDYKGDTAAYEAAKKAADEKYAKVKEDAKKKAEELLAKKSAEEFKAYIKANLEEDYKAKGDDDKITDKEQEEIDAKMKALLTEKFAHGYESELECWIFGYVYTKPETNTNTNTSSGSTADKDKKPETTDKAALNATKLIEDTSKDSTGTYTVTVYMLAREAGRDETITKNVFYAAFPTANKTEAEALVTEFGASATKDFAAFETLANAKKATIVKENLNNGKGDFGYDEIDEWLFSADTKAGALKNIAVKDYNVVVYVVGDGDAQWYADIHETMTDEDSEEWVENAVKELALKYNTKFLNKIDA